MLGRFRLIGPEGPINLGSAKLCGLLAILASSRRPQPRERLMSMLWGSRFEAQAQQSLRQAMSRLRRMLGDDLFLTHDHLLSLQPGILSCDLEQFDASIREGSPASLALAAKLYTDTFLSDVRIKEATWADWLSGERSRLETMALDTFIRLGELELGGSNPEQALELAQRAVGIDNLREDAHRLMIGALAATGRRAEALRHYEQIVALLRRSLNVAPDPLTRELADRVRAETAAVGLVQIPADIAIAPATISTATTSTAVPEPWEGDGNVPTVLVAAFDNGDSKRSAFVEQVCREALTSHEGRLLGRRETGFVLEFPHTRAATSAAFSIQSAVASAVIGPSDMHVPIRIGAHVVPPSDRGQTDHGRTIELAEQLSALAGPGEVILSEDARDQLTPVLDAEIDDLGERPTLSPAAPIRGFRASLPSRDPMMDLSEVPVRLGATVAVIPFASQEDRAKQVPIGEILAAEIIAALSLTSDINVISRLSTTVFRTRPTSLNEIQNLLRADYVLSGTYTSTGDRVSLFVELAEARTGQVVWGDRLYAPAAALVNSHEFIDRIVSATSAAIIRRELQRSQVQPIPTQENYTLMLGAIALMHQLSHQSVERARELLVELISRAPRHAMPHAWLAHLHILRVSQGWVQDYESEARYAIECTQRALDAEPTCSLALAIDGHVYTHLMRRFDLANERLGLAVENNPNESLAWLLKGTTHAFMGEGGPALQSAELALRLSPLDPRRWYYDSLTTAAALAAGHYERAIDLARRSIRGNRTHTSSFRALAVAQVLSGRVDDARMTVAELMRLQPTLTVSQYLARHPASEFEIGRTWAQALKIAGVPE